MTTAPIGRRAQNRAARHEQLLNAATEIIAECGMDGLTMLAVAERVDCAVGTIYTYFDSKSALLAELQVAAIRTMVSTLNRSRGMWEEEIELAELDEALAALVRLVAFGHLFTSLPQLHPREFELLQALISSPRRELSPQDTPTVVPHAMEIIGELHVLIDRAVAIGALSQRSELGEGEGQTLSRTLRWAGGLNGALLVSNATSDPAWLSAEVLDGRVLARRLAADLLLGWGAPPFTLATATAFIEDLSGRDRLVRAAEEPVAIDSTTAEHAQVD